MFKRLDFQSLATKVAAGAAPQALEERDYVTVRDAAGLAAMTKELRAAGSFAVDTETTSLVALQAELVGVSFSARPGRALPAVPARFVPAVRCAAPPAEYASCRYR